MESEVHGLYTELAKRVNERDWFDYDNAEAAIRALLEQPTSVLKMRLDIRENPVDGSVANVCRAGDVVIGFYLDEDAGAPCEVSITVGSVPIEGHPIVLHPGEVTRFYGASHEVFPIIGVCYSELHLFGDAEILKHASVVYGLFSSRNVRAWIATNFYRGIS